MAVTSSMVQILLVILMVPTVHGLVYSGCHNLTVELFKWTCNGRDHRGNKCDPWIAGKQCDPYFYICIDNKVPHDGTYSNRWSGTTMASCDYSGRARRTVEYHNKNSVTFGTGPNALASGLHNPLKYMIVTRPWRKARLYVKIEDEDTGGDDPIDEHMIDLNGLNLDGTGNKWAYPFSTDVIDHNWVRKESRGAVYSTTASKLIINYKAVCCEDYYDYDCEVFCIPQANTEHGFYTCDPMTGEPICRDGFIDPTTDPPCVSTFDHCATFSCFNGGVHVPKPLEQTCVCSCPPGTSGHRCQTLIEVDTGCPTPSPCINGGTCEDTSDGYKCICPQFYVGDTCQYTKCQSNDIVCQNNGVCIEGRGCECPAPFHGFDCSQCDCSGHGICDKTAGKCNCNPGWDGDICNVEICKYKTCLNGGKCIAGRCLCKEEFTGEFCEYGIEHACASSPCQNGATCNPLTNGYKCECKVLFHGDHCEYELPKNNSLKEDPKFEEKEKPIVEKTIADSSTGIPIWVWVIVGVAVLLLIIVLLLALLWRQKRKRRHAEAQTEHVMRNGAMKNFDNPLYGNENRGAQTQTQVNGVAVGTQANHYDTPKNKKGIFTVFGGKKKGIDDTENPYDDIGTQGSHYDVPKSAKGDRPPPLPKRSTRREGGQFDNPTYTDTEGGGKKGKKKGKPPAYLSGAPPYQAEPPSPINVVPVDYVEPASPDDDDDDPAKKKKVPTATLR